MEHEEFDDIQPETIVRVALHMGLDEAVRLDQDAREAGMNVGAYLVHLLRLDVLEQDGHKGEVFEDRLSFKTQGEKIATCQISVGNAATELREQNISQALTHLQEAMRCIFGEVRDTVDEQHEAAVDREKDAASFADELAMAEACVNAGNPDHAWLYLRGAEETLARLTEKPF